MAKQPSRKRVEGHRANAKNLEPSHPKTTKKPGKARKIASKAKNRLAKTKFGRFLGKKFSQIRHERAEHIHLHRSFKRSYREDYLRETETPGLLSHAILTFKTIFRQWRIFLPFILLMLPLYTVMVGLMSEETYQKIAAEVEESGAELAGGEIGNFAKAGLVLLSTFTTGGFDTTMNEAGIMFVIVLFLIMWLVTIFLLRHIFAGEQPRLRDGLYNALGPLLSTLVIFVLIFVQAVPIMLVAITYSAAVNTGFLNSPFYALVYFIFVLCMTILSGYLLSGSLFALVAVTVPGLYPVRALFAAADMVAGRRIRIILRALYLIFVLAFIYLVVMLPVILLDMWLKSIWSGLAGWPFVSIALVCCTCFVFIYVATYIYIYYRWLLEQPKVKRGKA